MPIVFSPNGNLDVSTDPSDLPEQSSGKVSMSGAMTRCTNLHLDRLGIASTRYGTSKINNTAIVQVNNIIEQGGHRYSFGAGNIYKDESSIETGLSSDEMTTVLYNPYNIEEQAIYCLNGTDRIKIEDDEILEWGIDPPEEAPTVVTDALYVCTCPADYEDLEESNYYQFTIECNDNSNVCYSWEKGYIENLTNIIPEVNDYISMYFFESNPNYDVDGIYEVVYTYCRYDGDVLVCESAPSDAVEVTIDSNLTISWVPSSDPQVNAVRMYRSLVDTAGQWLYAGVWDVTIGAANLTSKDDELGAPIDTDNSRPPLGSYVFGPSLGGQLYILKDNKLYYSRPLQPEYWPETYYVEVSTLQFPLVGGTIWAGNVFVASDVEIYLVSGSGANSYFPQQMSAITGTKSRNCFLGVKGTGLFHLGNDGIYLYTASTDDNISNEVFKPIFNGQNAGSIPGLNVDNIGNCYLLQHGNKIWFGYPAIGETYMTDWLVLNLGSKRWVHYKYPFALTCATIDYTNNQIIGCDTDGYLRRLDDVDKTDDNGTAISYDLESKQFSQFPLYFPRYARWDVDLGTNGVATGEIRLDSVTTQSHPIRVSRQTRKRLIDTCTGTRLSVRVTGTGNVDIYGVEVE